ncbi:DUF4397 domain-containing protein [Chitinophaga eiseniae]|uniref:DUF4397 domain-containing protein n=1 Tax=Chitinophaga eiseniae TaxID=634771 RepID=A0A847SS79_9BACT|nr:DUF4397 domain-containing protein [Chitinophaga eiseniae]NLR80396.1 DUF4397 domain-containing protein [Chitinophaga eiseniae]
MINIHHYRNAVVRFFLIIMAAGSFAACNKPVTLPDITPKGQVNFYFAATAFLGGIKAGGNDGYLVLIDSRDTTYKPESDIFHSIYPFLHRVDLTPPAYPAGNSTWIKYMEISTGKHAIYLLDTSRTILDSAQLELAPAAPTMVFFGERHGIYQHIIANDAFTPADGKIGIRIVNLSPFNGSVYLAMNKVIPAALPVNTTYLDHTGFIPIDCTGPQTLSIKVYQPADSVQFLAHTSLDVVPGHAYTLVLNGYTDSDDRSYTDPRTGKTVNITTDFSISALKNF